MLKTTEGSIAAKRRRISFALPIVSSQQSWASEFNLDGKVERFQEEVGDGASSRVYVGSLHGIDMFVAVKQLKCYSPRLASNLIKAYEHIFHLRHDNLVRVFGICPKVGYVVMEYCRKDINGHTLRTLSDLLLHYGDDLPEMLRMVALSDVAEGLKYLHSQSLIHGDIKPQNVLVTGNEQEFVFKITDYSCIMHINANQLSSSRSSSLKQLMTPGYLAPELISETGNYLHPTKASDVYSFAILAYEVAFCCDPWPKVSMQLIDAVRRGYRPVIPNDASKFMSAVIQECWQHDSSSCPYASQVSQLFEEHLVGLTGSDACGTNSSDTPTTAVRECNTTSDIVGTADGITINSNPSSTYNACPILNQRDYSDSCDISTSTVNQMQAPDEPMQGTLDCNHESNSNISSVLPIPRDNCDINALVETNSEFLPQDSPSGCLEMDIEPVQANDDMKCMIDGVHDGHANVILHKVPPTMYVVLKRLKRPCALRS